MSKLTKEELAEKYMSDTYASGYSPDKNWCMHFGPNDMKKSFLVGHASRDAEVAELKAALERELSACNCPAGCNCDAKNEAYAREVLAKWAQGEPEVKR